MALEGGLEEGEVEKGPKQSGVKQTSSFCPFCKKELNTIDNGWDEDVVCPACGHVVSDLAETTLVSEVEWAADGTRRPLGQRVSGVANDARSARLLAKLKQQFSQAAVTLHLPASVLLTAEGLAVQAESHGLRGLSTPPVAGALLYLSCRAEGAPCRLPDVAAAVNADVGQTRHLYYLLLKLLDVQPPPPSPAILAASLWARVVGNRPSQVPAPMPSFHQLCGWADEHRLMEGWQPMAVAAAAVYLSASAQQRESIMIDELARAAGLSVSSLSRRLASLNSQIAAVAAKVLPGVLAQNSQPASFLPTLMRLTTVLETASVQAGDVARAERKSMGAERVVASQKDGTEPISKKPRNE